MPKMLAQWLQYLESLHPSNIEMGLERLTRVAKQLGLTEKNCQVVTVAGTNGKGSCVAALESILCANGLRVGAYTSPHIQVFNERIRIQGQPVSDQALIEAFETIENVRSQLAIPLTFFEFTTLAGLLLFKTARLDVMILEVGLGGRLDAVNIIPPDIAIITSIAFDHTDYLGNTLDDIAYEKGGIIRANSRVILGLAAIQPRLQMILAQCKPENVFQIEKNFALQSDSFQSRQAKWTGLPSTSLAKTSVACALQAVACLSVDFPLELAAIKQGLQTVNLSGRMQRVLFQNKTIILDVAHNPHAIAHLQTQLMRRLKQGRVHAIVGMMADKDIDASLQAIAPLVSAWYVTDLPQARAASACQLSKCLQAHRLKPVFSFNSMHHALWEACNQSSHQDWIVVFGSFYTVAAALDVIQQEKQISLKPQHEKVTL